MRPSALTPGEIADPLAQMYTADHGQFGDIPTSAERATLAENLGCHEESLAIARATELHPIAWDRAEYCLDVKFIEPCPEHQQ